MTHHELCQLAAKWIRRYRRCTVVLVDVKTINTREQPDVLAWQNYGYSFLVEAKVDVQDFIRDHHKPFRKIAEKGMGRERWIAMPKGLWDKVPAQHRNLNLNPSVILDSRWGLVEFDDKGKAKVLYKPVAYPKSNLHEEMRLLITSVRRVTEGWGRGMIEGAPPELLANGDRHPMYRIRELENKLRAETRMHEKTKKELVAERETLDSIRNQARATIAAVETPSPRPERPIKGDDFDGDCG